MVDATPTTPLISAPTPTPPTPALPTKFLWYHYLILAFCVYYIVQAFILSLSSIWLLIFGNASFAIMGYVGYELYKLKPRIIPAPFIVSQLGMATLDTPFYIMLLFIVISISALILYAFFAAILMLTYFIFNFNSATVFMNDLNQFFHSFDEITFDNFGDFVNVIISAYMKIWYDMIDAGGQPILMVLYLGIFILFTILLFVFGGGIALSSSVEYLKFHMLKRVKSLPEAPASLGLNGLVSIACLGSLGFVTVVAIGTLAVIEYTLVSAIIFSTTYILDSIIVIGSQLYVATVYAEKVVLGKHVQLMHAFKDSVLYNFGMLLFRVMPSIKNTPNILTQNLWLFFIATSIRAVLAFYMTKKFYAHYLKVRSEEREVPQA